MLIQGGCHPACRRGARRANPLNGCCAGARPSYLHSHIGLAGIDTLAGRRQRRLVLRLKHNVNDLEHGTVALRRRQKRVEASTSDHRRSLFDAISVPGPATRIPRRFDSHEVTLTASSGTTRRLAGLDCVNSPGPVATIEASGARMTACLLAAKRGRESTKEGQWRAVATC